ncbi:MAG: histidine kinase, partial [Prevotella sp.]|nr:histidine kinase [Prevotella sp.]
MKAKHKGIIIEWGILTIISFLFYDIIWIPTSEDFSFLQIKDVANYLLADFTYCACLSFCIIWIDFHIAQLNYFSQVCYKRQLLLSLTILFSNVIISVILENTYELLLSVPYDSFEEGILIVCLISTLSTLAHCAQYYSRMISIQSEEIITIQKRMLKMQLDPHFIFNCLNILTGIVHTSSDAAEEFIIRLSRIYRYIIKSIEQDVASVNNAINFAVDYVALLNIRFPNKLDFQVDASLDKNNYDYIPVMSLQLLIENAVKHNIPDDYRKLQIKISRRDNNLIVRNSINETEIY